MKVKILTLVPCLLIAGCVTAAKNPVSYSNPAYKTLEEETAALRLTMASCTTMAEIMNPYVAPSYVQVPEKSGFARGFATGQNAGASIAAGMRAGNLRKDFQNCMMAGGWEPIYKDE